MKFLLNSEKKTIEVLEDIKLEELVKTAQEMLGDTWKELTLKSIEFVFAPEQIIDVDAKNKLKEIVEKLKEKIQEEEIKGGEENEITNV